MPVEFFTDEQAAACGRFAGCPPQAELERVFLLDDADSQLVGARRGAHNRLGFALQLTTVRYLGTFLPDPLDVSSAVVDFLAAQLEIDDASCVKSYTERTKTPYEHQWEIRRVCGYRDFTEAAQEAGEFLTARAWTRVETAKTLFEAAVAWLRQHRVLLPGVSVLTRLVIEHRQRAAQQLHTTVAQAATATDPEMPSRLTGLLAVADPDDDTYHRSLNAQLNTTEHRHRLARKLCFDHRSELRQAYQQGMKDQLGTLGLVLNAAIDHLRAQNYPVADADADADADAARLSPLIDTHLNVHGTYSFVLPQLDGLRPLRDPTDLSPDTDRE